MYTNKDSMVNSFGEALAELGGINKNIVVLDADLSHATKSCYFAAEFPQRFFNMGIAEQDMISTSAGLASAGKIPFACSFAIFVTGNAYAQIRLAAFARHNIKIIGSHAGIKTGPDGATHQALEDITMMRTIPGMTVIQPSDPIEARLATIEIAKYKNPVYMRLCRGSLPIVHDENYKFEIGKGEIISEGKDITIIATGALVWEAIKAASELAAGGINAEVINISTIKPLDEKLIIESAQKTKQVIICEDHSTTGGLGSAVEELLCKWYECRVHKIGMKDVFGESGEDEELYKIHGLDSENIAAIVAMNKGSSI